MTVPDHITPTGPYSTGVDAYWKAGWRGILPLPAKAKKNPPRGFTGDAGIDPSYADITAWATDREGAGNIALRMPRNVVGIDVDAYGDKHGRATIDQAEKDHGALPATWRTTSRDDGVSGIRLYRVPEGLDWPGEIGPSTELIQHRHRYAVVWPSVHPEGRTYRWIDPDGIVSTRVPDIDELPLLPDAWVDAYTGRREAVSISRDNQSTMQAAAWLTGLDHAHDAMCARMEAAVEQMLTDLTGSAHNAARDATLRAIRLADEGHHGALAALAAMRAAFIKDATSADRQLLGKARRSPDEAAVEWSDLVTSAANVVTGEPSGILTCDCYGQITGLITGPAEPAVAEPDVDAPPAAETTPDAEDTAPKRLKDGATFILDAPTEVPSVWGYGDEVLWSKGESLMIVGPPGVGKTTITGNVLRGLLGLQDAVLGLHVSPSDGRVLYLAMDRPAQIARALRRAFHDDERDVLAQRLRVWEGPPPGDIAKHTDLLVTLANLAGATTVIIDSVKDAAVGLTEDEVGAGYNRARQKALSEGIQLLELHHLVKRGANGSKPTTLADVYGSAWLTAGTGSVLMLWGSAGDPIVEATHLKQPAAEVGPYRLRHDHERGETHIFHQADLVQLAAATGRLGLTAKQAAQAVEQNDDPTPSQVEKARRKLDGLVRDGLLERVEGKSGGTGGGSAARWIVAESVHESVHGPDFGPTVHGDVDTSRSRSIEPHESVHGVHGQTVHGSAPSFKEGGPNTTDEPHTVERVIAGRRVRLDLSTGEVVEP